MKPIGFTGVDMGSGNLPPLPPLKGEKKAWGPPPKRPAPSRKRIMTACASRTPISRIYHFAKARGD